MRWEGQSLDVEDLAALPGMGRLAGFVRTVRTPEFAGVTFHEVHSRSALNKVPGNSPMPFRWTINPYRGCTHGCVYCFARNTHTYLDFDAGRDFDSQIVVKINIGRVLRKEVASSKWRREHVAMGTNTDPYQRAEGRYRLMPDVISALADSGTPFSILTKGTVLSRDLGLLAAAGRSVPVGIGVSLALLDPELQATLEPGTPTPRARLDLVRRIRTAGLPCGVFVAPLLPYLTDTREQITALMAELAEAGVTGVSGIGLHLRPGARDWFFRWLGENRPDLVERYRQLYSRGANLPVDYRRELAAKVRTIAADFGLGSDAGQELSGLDRRAEGAPVSAESPVGQTISGLDRPTGGGMEGADSPAERRLPEQDQQARQLSVDGDSSLGQRLSARNNAVRGVPGDRTASFPRGSLPQRVGSADPIGAAEPTLF